MPVGYPTNFSSTGGSVDSSIYATHYYVNTTDSVGTITKGVWNGTAIDTTYTNAVSNVTAGNGITVTTEGKTKKVASTLTGSQWTTSDSGIYINSNVSIGTDDTGYLFEIKDTTNNTIDFIIDTVAKTYLFYSNAGTENMFLGGGSFVVSSNTGTLTLDWNTGILSLTSLNQFTCNVNAVDSDDVVVFSQVQKSMLIQLTQTGTDAPDAVVKHNTSQYNITGTSYANTGEYNIDFDCVDCMDIGNYYLRSTAVYYSGSALPLFIVADADFSSGNTLEVMVQDYTSAGYDDIGMPFYIELIWFE
jgi:hypothetical protein